MSKTTDDYANKNQELEPGPKHEKEKNHTRVVSLPLWDLRGKPIERNWRLRVRPRHSAAHLIGCLLREYCTYTRIVDACELQRKDLYRTHESCMMMVMMMMSMMALVPLWARPRRLMFYACTSFRSFQVLTPGSPKSQPFYTLFIVRCTPNRNINIALIRRLLCLSRETRVESWRAYVLSGAKSDWGHRNVSLQNGLLLRIITFLSVLSRHCCDLPLSFALQQEATGDKTYSLAF